MGLDALAVIFYYFFHAYVSFHCNLYLIWLFVFEFIRWDFMLREDGRMCPMTKCSCSYYDLLTCNYTLFLFIWLILCSSLCWPLKNIISRHDFNISPGIGSKCVTWQLLVLNGINHKELPSEILSKNAPLLKAWSFTSLLYWFNLLCMSIYNLKDFKSLICITWITF